MSQVNVTIIKVYSYRTAKLTNFIRFPRETFKYVEDKIEPAKKDNHIVVIAQIEGDRVWERVAIMFTDGMCLVANENNVIEKEW